MAESEFWKWFLKWLDSQRPVVRQAGSWAWWGTREAEAFRKNDKSEPRDLADGLDDVGPEKG